MASNFMGEGTKPDIFEYLASLNDKELMTNFYSDPSCCICTFRFLHSIAQGIIYKLLFVKSSIDFKTLRKWPEAKNDAMAEMFEIQFEKLNRLQILLRKGVKKGDDDELYINPIFAKNLKIVLSTDHELSLVKEKTTVEKNAPSQDELNQSAKFKLQKIILFMLNIINYDDMSQFVIDLLVEANFIEENQGIWSLTVDGFRFILEDVNSQIHILLLNYIKQKKSSPQHLQLIFQLILSNQSSYKINESSSIDQQSVIDILIELKQIGLIFMKKTKRFYVTQLMRSFLLGGETPFAAKSLMTGDKGLDGTSADRSYQIGEDKSIIVETNFRVYCYTSSELYKAIMDLFCQIDIVFPNLIGGLITRTKMREAFRKGISAEQIAMFLNKHAHDQMYIKKEIEDEKDNPIGTLVDSRDTTASTARRQAKRMLDKNSSVIPRNVVDQMHIWETEMNCLKCQEGCMISNFDNRDKYDQFKGFLKSSNIMPLDWNDKSMTVVVALDSQKDIYEFLNKH